MNEFLKEKPEHGYEDYTDNFEREGSCCKEGGCSCGSGNSINDGMLKKGPADIKE